MEPISVTGIQVKNETLTFQEPPLKDVLKAAGTLRGLLQTFNAQSSDQETDGLDFFFNLMEDSNTFASLCQILSLFSGRPADFFDDLRPSDAMNIYEGIVGSELERVFRRFFTKVTKKGSTNP